MHQSSGFIQAIMFFLVIAAIIIIGLPLLGIIIWVLIFANLLELIYIYIAYILTRLHIFDINRRYAKDNSLLIFATKHNFISMSRDLINMGIDVHRINNSGFTALDYTLNATIAQMLLDHGLQWNPRCILHNLERALSNHNLAFAKLLYKTLPHDVDPAHLLLEAAANVEQQEVVEFLLAQGAPAHKIDEGHDNQTGL